MSIDFEGGRVTGRLEHLKTGRGSRFASADKLMAGIERLLASADSRRGASRT